MSSLSINTNLNALTARRQATQASDDLSEKLERLASGLRINSASDDAAGLAISQKFTSQIRGGAQATQNLQDGLSLLQTAEGATQQIQESLQRSRELAVQSANATLTDEDRANIQQEIDQLTEEIDRIASDTQFNKKNLLDGSLSSGDGGVPIQAGADEGETVSVSVEDLSAEALGVNDVDVQSQTSAVESLGLIDGAINQVSTERASLGSAVNRLESAIDSSLIQQENEAAARSRIRDANLAREATERAQASILAQSGTSALAQANNLQGSNALQLLG
jgi:flagellin